MSLLNRVCIVSPVPVDGSRAFPGIERFVEGMCAGLTHNGSFVRVVTPQGAGQKSQEIKAGVEFVYLPNLADRIGRLSGLLSANLYYIEHALLRRPGLVDGFDLAIFSMPFGSLPKLANKVSLGTTAVVLQHREYWSSLSLALSIPAADVMVWRSRPDFFVVPSQFSLSQFTELTRAPREKFRVIPWGVDHSLFRATRVAPAPWTHEQRSPVLLYVGTGERRKNVGMLLEAFAEVLEEVPGTTLVMVGPGHENSRQLTRAKRLENAVRFAGVVPEEEIFDFYASADIIVSASIREGFGLPFLEAMACGKPVVAIQAGSIPEVVKDGGILVRPDSPADFAQAVCRLLLSHEEYERCATRAAKVAGGFSWESTARLFLSLCR